jgi:hypothetical protein
MMGIMCNPRAIKEIAIRLRPGTPLSRQAKNHEFTPAGKENRSKFLASTLSTFVGIVGGEQASRNRLVL